MSILIVAAARPNFMKVAPILRCLDEADVNATLVHTGQHYDEAMSDRFFADLGMRAPDIHLGCAASSHAETTANVMVAFDQVVATTSPDIIVVVGDVDSTLACGLVAAKRGVPLAHVEAGLRSRDRAMPEEVNRIVVDSLSDWLFTPSPDATANLIREGVSPQRIHWVGNVMVDSLLATVGSLDVDEMVQPFGVTDQHYALLTMHRPSNVDDPVVLERLISTVVEVSEQIPVVFPVHPRTAQRLAAPHLHAILADAPHLIRVAPLGYRESVALQAGASFVMTDSGGIQEETTVLGVPCMTLRDNTERPITVTHGTNRVVGTEPERILEAVNDALLGMRLQSPPRPDGWDGRTAERIVDVLLNTTPPLDSERPAAGSVQPARLPHQDRVEQLT
jgi:UDP-N-acetylglucosamine 2-epimerase (non-hydrolysing)